MAPATNEPALYSQLSHKIKINHFTRDSIKSVNITYIMLLESACMQSLHVLLFLIKVNKAVRNWSLW